MARSVPDIGLMLDAMATLSAHDPLSRPVPSGGYQASLRRGRPPRRIGFSANLGLRSIDPEVASICEAAVQTFKAIDCAVEGAAPDFSGAIDCFQVLRALMFAGVRGELLPAERNRINPDIVWNIEKGLTLSGTEIIGAQRTREALFHRVARFFDDFELLACPTVAVPPFPVQQRFPTEIAGETLTTYIDWMFLTFAVTLTGCPAISLPCGLTKAGLPIGLQLVGRPHGDADLIGMARFLEEALAFKALVMVAQATAGCFSG
jgi:amidase